MTVALDAERIRFIEHGGKRILYQDCSNFEYPKDVLAAIERIAALTSAEPLRSVLAMTIVTGTRFDRHTVDALKAMAVANKPYIKASCLVGLTGIQKAVYAALSQLTGRRLPGFATTEEALAWLIVQE